MSLAAMPSSQQPTPRESFRAGLRAGVPFALAGGLLSLTFGVLPRGRLLGARRDRHVGDRLRRLGAVRDHLDPRGGGGGGGAARRSP